MNSAALVAPNSSEMLIHSDLLGPLEVAPVEMIFFPGGIFGFPEARMFVLLPADREGVFWLQSTDHGTLAFLLVDPFLFADEYVVDLSAADRAELQITNPADVAILTIVTLPRDRQELPTANLQGPLAVNLSTRRAKQLVVADTRFDIRTPVDLSRLD
jgi:flagellar assembly factor FliW